MNRKIFACLTIIEVFLVFILPENLLFGGSSLMQSSRREIPASDNWPMFHRDIFHTGESSSAGPVTNETLWRFNTGGPMDSPVVSRGLGHHAAGKWAER